MQSKIIVSLLGLLVAGSSVGFNKKNEKQVVDRFMACAEKCKPAKLLPGVHDNTGMLFEMLR